MIVVLVYGQRYIFADGVVVVGWFGGLVAGRVFLDVMQVLRALRCTRWMELVLRNDVVWSETGPSWHLGHLLLGLSNLDERFKSHDGLEVT